MQPLFRNREAKQERREIEIIEATRCWAEVRDSQLADEPRGDDGVMGEVGSQQGAVAARRAAHYTGWHRGCCPLRRDASLPENGNEFASPLFDAKKRSQKGSFLFSFLFFLKKKEKLNKKIKKERVVRSNEA